MKKRRLHRVSISVFVGLISTDISDLILHILVYSCREFQVLKEYTKILKNRLVISVDIKPTKTEAETRRRRRFFIASTEYLKRLHTNPCFLYA